MRLFNLIGDLWDKLWNSEFRKLLFPNDLEKVEREGKKQEKKQMVVEKRKKKLMLQLHYINAHLPDRVPLEPGNFFDDGRKLNTFCPRCPGRIEYTMTLGKLYHDYQELKKYYHHYQ